MAVDAATGGTVWTFRPDAQAVTVPALDDVAMYTGQRGIPMVYALSRADGALRWKVNVGVGYAFEAHVRGVAVSGDTLYVGLWRYLTVNGAQSSAVLVALDRRDGRELWRYETGGPFHYFVDAPVVSGGLVLASDFGTGDLVAIDVATRREAWRTAAGGSVRIAVVGQTAFTAGFDQKARGIDVTSGAVKWTGATGSSALGLGACGGNAYVTAFLLRRFDGTTGAITGEGRAGSGDVGFVTNVASDGARVYVSGTTGVFAYRC